MTPDFLDLIKVVGLPLAMALAALAAGAKGVWHYGNTYRSLERDRDYWRELALRGTDLAEKSFEIQVDRRAGGQRPPGGESAKRTRFSSDPLGRGD